ncbi:MAG: hypothetical protein RIC55_19675 [Pirellulaceae bacterium]
MEAPRTVRFTASPGLLLVAAWMMLLGHVGLGQAFAAEHSSGASVEGSEVRLAMVTPVSADFRRRAESAARSVPENVWRGLRRAGWRLHVAEFVTDAAPALRGLQPRGWPAGMTWENTDAVHLPKSRLMIFAERRRDQNGAVVPSHRLEGVMRHEIGHAFDRASGGEAFRSASGDFLRVYFDETRRISAEDRSELAYYLQRGAAGRQETFAEAFALLLGGGSDAPHRGAFQRAFPRVLRYVERTIAEFEARPPAATVAVQNP